MFELTPFSASRWVAHPHAQTLLGELFAAKPKLTSRFESLKISLRDGDVLINDYLPGNTPVVALLCHGLTGNSRSGYLLRSAEYLHQAGHHVVLMNHRNCGIGFGHATRPYHSGKGDDIGEVIFFLRKKFPDHVILLYGYSLSANAALRLLGEPEIFFTDPKNYLPDAAFVANPPIHLERAAKLLTRGFNQIYERFFVLGLTRLLNRQIAARLVNPDKLDLKNFHFGMRIKEFDHHFTSIYSGYQNADDYYEKCSTVNKIKNIKTPTLIVTSSDDPFVAVEDFRSLKLPRNVQLIITTGGGHLGYLAKNKTPLKTRRWLDYAAITFTEQFLTTKKIQTKNAVK